jgi:hypothetical protein
VLGKCTLRNPSLRLVGWLAAAKLTRVRATAGASTSVCCALSVTIANIHGALSAFVQRACLNNASPLREQRAFEYFSVSVPLPDQLAQLGPFGHSWRLALLDSTWQQHDAALRALPEYDALVQNLKEATELADILPCYLEEYGLTLLRDCIDDWLNTGPKSLSTDGSVALLVEPAFDGGILGCCETVCRRLEASWRDQRHCVVYAPIEGLSAFQRLPLLIRADLDIVPDGMLPLSVLKAERKARRSYALRSGGTLHLRYALPGSVEGRNHSAPPASAAASVQAFLTALRFERRGWLAAPCCIVESNLPWLEVRDRVIDQNLPLGLLYDFDTQVDVVSVGKTFEVLVQRLPSLAHVPKDGEPYHYLIWALQLLDQRSRTALATAQAANVFMAFDALFGVDRSADSKWVENAKYLVGRDCWAGRPLHSLIGEAYVVRCALFHEGHPPTSRGMLLVALLEDLITFAARWILESIDDTRLTTKTGFHEALKEASPKKYCPRQLGAPIAGQPWGTRQGPII